MERDEQLSPYQHEFAKNVVRFSVIYFYGLMIFYALKSFSAFDFLWPESNLHLLRNIILLVLPLILIVQSVVLVKEKQRMGIPILRASYYLLYGEIGVCILFYLVLIASYFYSQFVA